KMNDNISIKVENVCKKYCKSLKRSMLYGVKDIARNTFGLSSHSDKLRKNEFWALDDISFEVKKGVTLGIIGPNGSGKTTLLKLLNGIFWPDKGKITIKGKVGALIEVGAGFHPLLTGRENIYINAAILGMSKEETDKKFDTIVEFADIGDFLDVPVKHYSSGMFVRLGFAVAVHCEPDILLVDEVLAVGDKNFGIKCYQKMHEIKKRGTTIILVSHNEYTIREQTENCLYINNGKMKFLGPSEKSISIYIKEILENKTKNFPVGEIDKPKLPKKAEIASLKFFDKTLNEISFIESGQELNIVLECIMREKLNNPIFGVNFYENSGFIYCANNDYENVAFKRLPLGKVRIKISIPHFYLPTNNYLCSVNISEENNSNLIDWHNMVYKFVVGRAKNARGSIKLPTEWEVEKI
ncbi:MAG: ABC transporter ATP-binding protein, partial [Candidatus Delongbacteria bacterium]|nr:ABC transporter ATP-binding protein [Candidatus Delongbacteria bacterium]